MFPEVPVALVTFGCPKVGNDIFLQQQASLLESNHRFIHGEDLVPALPPFDIPFFTSYEQGGDPVWLTYEENGEEVAYNLLLTDRPEGLIPISVGDHSMQKGYMVALASLLGLPAPLDPPEGLPTKALEPAEQLGQAGVGDLINAEE